MNGKTTVLVIVLILLGIAGGYYLGTNYKFTLQPQGAVSVTAAPSPSPTPQPTADQPLAGTPSAATVTPVDETATLIAAVKAGLVAEHGPDAASMTITVSKIQGNFAQGGASAQGGGGMWFAAKVGGVWKLAWDGNGTISCTSIDPYNFPVSMIPECWNDATGKIITR
jgi:hypothetical protein